MTRPATPAPYPPHCPGCGHALEAAVRAVCALTPPGSLVIVTWACHFTVTRKAGSRSCRTPTALVLSDEDGVLYFHDTEWNVLERRLVARYGESARWTRCTRGAT